MEKVFSNYFHGNSNNFYFYLEHQLYVLTVVLGANK